MDWLLILHALPEPGPLLGSNRSAKSWPTSAAALARQYRISRAHASGQASTGKRSRRASNWMAHAPSNQQITIQQQQHQQAALDNTNPGSGSEGALLAPGTFVLATSTTDRITNSSSVCALDASANQAEHHTTPHHTCDCGCTGYTGLGRYSRRCRHSKTSRIEKSDGRKILANYCNSHHERLRKTSGHLISGR